jgi:hypothetical protein
LTAAEESWILSAALTAAAVDGKIERIAVSEVAKMIPPPASSFRPSRATCAESVAAGCAR